MKFRFNCNWLGRTIQLQSDVKILNAATSQPQRLFKRFSTEGSVAAVEESSPAPLFDLHGRRHNYLRISLTERCNLRCKYCMPAAGVPLSPRGALLSRGELARLARLFAALGADKVRLTGGEPTLRPDLEAVVSDLASVRGLRSLGLTTNGLVLTRRLPALQRAGLTHLNVSLDSLRAHRYEAVTRRPGLARVLAGVDLALQLGYSPVKINVVLVKGFNDDEIDDFVELTRDRDIEVRFIEFMPFTGNRWRSDGLVPHLDALGAAGASRGLRREPPRGNDTAELWRADGHRGTVGFISSMTQPFCGSCNRLRLTADGNLKVCLFGASEVSLRDAMRGGADDAALEALVRAALRNKKPQHAGEWSPLPRAAPARALTTRSPLARHAGAAARGGQPADGADRRVAARGYRTLTHLDGAGRARMVDVGDKPVTRRAAVAECRVHVSAELARLLRSGRLPKGDAACVARVAGTLAAKRAADLLPLCHPLPLECARVDVSLPAGAGAGAVVVRCEVRVRARTGAEMEALAGCAVAALALYDMCKSADRHMRITDLRLLSKSGGRGGDYRAPPAPAPAAAPAADDAH